MIKFTLFIAPILSLVLPSFYNTGDVINQNHQNHPLEICYGDDIGETIYLGDNNGGITVLGLSSWG
tara:strand:+ start:708 stop:905 length:198 start_codon:yes stop_codon:yes gene_type:complete